MRTEGERGWGVGVTRLEGRCLASVVSGGNEEDRGGYGEFFHRKMGAFPFGNEAFPFGNEAFPFGNEAFQSCFSCFLTNWRVLFSASEAS